MAAAAHQLRVEPELLFPVAVWDAPPRHEVSCLCFGSGVPRLETKGDDDVDDTKKSGGRVPRAPPDEDYMVTGGRDGSLVVWRPVAGRRMSRMGTARDVEEQLLRGREAKRFTPRAMLHNEQPSPCSAVTTCVHRGRKCIVAVFLDGSVSVWDGAGGACLTHFRVLPLGFRARRVDVIQAAGQEYALVTGDGLDVCVVDMERYSVSHTLKHRELLAWSTLLVQRERDLQAEAARRKAQGAAAADTPVMARMQYVMTLTQDGMICTHFLQKLAAQHAPFQPVLRNEVHVTTILGTRDVPSRPVRLSASRDNKRLLIVLEHHWTVCSLADFQMEFRLLSTGSSLAGGRFVSDTRVVLWNAKGDIQVFRLRRPPRPGQNEHTHQVSVDSATEAATTTEQTEQQPQRRGRAAAVALPTGSRARVLPSPSAKPQTTEEYQYSGSVPTLLIELAADASVTSVVGHHNVVCRATVGGVIERWVVPSGGDFVSKSNRPELKSMPRVIALSRCRIEHGFPRKLSADADEVGAAGVCTASVMKQYSTRAFESLVLVRGYESGRVVVQSLLCDRAPVAMDHVAAPVTALMVIPLEEAPLQTPLLVVASKDGALTVMALLTGQKFGTVPNNGEILTLHRPSQSGAGFDDEDSCANSGDEGDDDDDGADVKKEMEEKEGKWLAGKSPFDLVQPVARKHSMTLEDLDEEGDDTTTTNTAIATKQSTNTKHSTGRQRAVAHSTKSALGGPRRHRAVAQTPPLSLQQSPPPQPQTTGPQLEDVHPVHTRHLSDFFTKAATDKWGAGSDADVVFAVDTGNNVLAVSLSTLECRQRFRGHDSPVRGIYRNEWCEAAGYVVVETRLGSAYVWCFSTGHLERRLTGSAADRFLFERRLRPPPARFLPKKSRSDLVHVLPGPQRSAHVFTVNVRQLLRHRNHERHADVSTYLFDWNEETLVRIQSKQLGLSPPHLRPSFAQLSNRNRSLCVLFPKQSHGKGRWEFEARLTATHALSLSTLCMSMTAKDVYYSQIVAHYSVIIPDSLPGYVEPALDVLASYALHPDPDVHGAARVLLQGTVERATGARKLEVVAEWTHVFFENDKRSEDAQLMASLVLCHIGCANAESLPPHAAQVVTGCLIKALFAEGRHSGLAADLLGKGFVMWGRWVKNIDALIHRLHGMRHRALTQVGVQRPKQFVAAMGAAALDSQKTPVERQAALEAIVTLVKKYPTALAQSEVLSRAVELVTRCLDPSEGGVRKAMLVPATTVLHALVQKYPMCAFHQVKQLFAVGSGPPKSMIVIYDLRTATKWRVLEGHYGTIVAVSFNKEGTRIVSYAHDENPPTVRAWRTDGEGLFGNIFDVSGKEVRMYKLAPILHKTRLRDCLNNVRVSWRGEGSVTVTREDGSVCTMEV